MPPARLHACRAACLLTGDEPVATGAALILLIPAQSRLHRKRAPVHAPRTRLRPGGPTKYVVTRAQAVVRDRTAPLCAAWIADRE